MLMIKSFEPVYKELEKLLIEKLPDYIQKINIKYNDQIILKPFENKELEVNWLKQPCFKFITYRATYSEKDRIICNTEFKINFEIKLNEYETFKIWKFERYIQAINIMLEETETEYTYTINEEEDFKFTIMVTVEK